MAATAGYGITGWLAGKDWTYIPTTRRVVALTFDAGANADAVPSILATLHRDGVPGVSSVSPVLWPKQPSFLPGQQFLRGPAISIRSLTSASAVRTQHSE
jgi:hypothetical protein